MGVGLEIKEVDEDEDVDVDVDGSEEDLECVVGVACHIEIE